MRFIIERPKTEIARLCLVEVGAKGPQRRPCSAERRDRESIAVRVMAILK